MDFFTSSSPAHEEESKGVNPPPPPSSSTYTNTTAGHAWCTENFTVPMGYRFHPTDFELVFYYLAPKILGFFIFTDLIPDIDVWITNPEQLLPIGKSRYWKENEAFFFTCKDQNFLKKKGKNVAEPHGFWKPERINEPIVHGKTVIGFKSKLVFYRSRSDSDGEIKEKTNWLMSEFRIHPRLISHPAHGKTNKLVLCKIEEIREYTKYKRLI